MSGLMAGMISPSGRVLNEEEQILEHVLDVLNRPIFNDIFEEAGISDIYDLLYADLDELKELTTLDAKGSLLRLKVADLSILKRSIEWFQSQPNRNIHTWMEFSLNKLQSHVATDRPLTIHPMPATSSISSAPILNSPAGPTPSVVPDVLPGISRNLADYPKLREDKLWLSFDRGLRSLAAIHALDDVLNPTYSLPTTEPALGQFHLKKTFMYTVFTNCLQTAKSRVILRSFEKTRDGHEVYKALCLAYANGTAATLSSESLETEIRSMKVDNNWTKPYETFLHLWSSKIQDLELIRDETVPDDDKRRWLTNALKGHSQLYAGITTAKSVEQTIRGVTGTAHLPWDRFYALVLDQAQILDSLSPQKKVQRAHNANTTPKHTGRRGKQYSNPSTHHSSTSNPPNSNNSNSNLPIPREKWLKMSAEERKKELEKRRRLRKKLGQPSSSTHHSNNNTVPSHPSRPTGNNSTQRHTNNANTNTTTPTDSASSPPAQQQAHRLLAQAQPATQAYPDITINGVTYRANTTRITYSAHRHTVTTHPAYSLVDRGANGGLGGADVTVLAYNVLQTADIDGIAGQALKNVPICTVAGLIQTTSGPVVGIFNQYAYTGKGLSIHSPLQFEAFGLQVRDGDLVQCRGQQVIVTPDGYKIPLVILNGLLHMSMTKPTDEDLVTYPQVIMTGDAPWDPSIFDTGCDPEDAHTCHAPYPKVYDDTPAGGNPTPHDHAAFHTTITACVESIKFHTPVSRLPAKPDFEKLRPLFGWIPVDRIKDTIKHTTQWYQAEGRLPMRRHFKSRFPGANVPRREETVATDTIFSDTPALDDGIPGHGGCTMMQFFCGCTSEFLAGFPMSSETQIYKTVQDFIRYYGAPRNLFSDNAKAEIATKVQDILRHYCIGHYRSEPHQQNQNPAERRIQEVKKHTNILLDRTGTPPNLWLLCMLYVMDLHNHIASTNLDHHITPIQKAFGYVPDISKFLQFHWYQRVLYRQNDISFPSGSYEGIGRFVGFAHNIGDVLTYHILTDDTQQVIARSMVRGLDPQNPNIRIVQPPHEGEDELAIPVVKSLVDTIDPAYDPQKTKLPHFSPEELLGLTFLHDLSDGQRVRAEVIKRINDMDGENHQNIKFIIAYGDPQYEEIISYAELSDIVEQQHIEEPSDEEKLHIYKKILSHHGPFKSSDKQYLGSRWNLRIEWEDGSITMEPLSIISKDDPGGCAKYAKKMIS